MLKSDSCVEYDNGARASAGRGSIFRKSAKGEESKAIDESPVILTQKRMSVRQACLSNSSAVSFATSKSFATDSQV